MRRPTCSVSREGRFLAYTQLTTFCQIPMWGRDRGGPSGVTSLKNTSQFSSYPLWGEKKKTRPRASWAGKGLFLFTACNPW